MGKPRPRAPMASLDSMASRIRDQKTTTAKTPGSSRLNSNSKNQKFTEDTSSSSESDGDSDDSGNSSDSDIEAARNKFTAQQANKRKNTQPQSNSAKSDAPRSTPDAKVPTSTKPASKATTSESDSSESDSDSSSNTSGANDKPAQTGAEKSGKKSESRDDSGSDSESSSESENGSEADVVTAQQPAEADTSSDSASDSGSDASKEPRPADAPDRMDVDGDEMAVSRVNGDKAYEDSGSQVSSRPAWLNSSDFVLRKASSDNPAKEVTEFFNNTNLEGKQVWYFTAPASLPITVLKDMEIDLSKVTTGQALLNHKGDDYGVDLESHATSTQIQLLIPSQAGDGYTALNRGIDSTVHLRRMAKFGPGNAVNATATEGYTPIPKAIRGQPEGLKPRFTPIGVPTPTPPPVQSSKPQHTPAAQNASSSESESESESASDEEGTTAATKPQPPASSGPSKKSQKPTASNGERKRKQPGDEGANPTPIHDSRPAVKSAKRPKTTQPTSKASSSKKAAPIQPQTLPVSNGAPSKVVTSSAKDKKEKKPAIKPLKETPIPLPILPSMKR
ncbi:hypothetical protein F5Y05DRAFT_340101 [Hypoxylon sp. FL0543]|nr:hypothetical protein F5Y05DRAFT_340101 [Hypoxylon sp. FL0543]